jgi:hypothetical protein
MGAVFSLQHLRNVSTRWRFAATFAVLAAILLVAVAALAALRARQSATADAAAALQQVASRMSMALEQDLAERLREIQHLASLQEVLEAPLDTGRWRELVDRLQASVPRYAWIGVTEMSGRVQAGTGRILEGQDVSARPWFEQGLRGPMLGDLHEALLLSRLLPPNGSGPLRLVDVAAPVTFEGEVMGVLGAHLSWRWAEDRRRELMATVDPERQIEVLVVSADGHVLLGEVKPMAVGDVFASVETPALRQWSDGGTYLTAAARAPPSRPRWPWRPQR